MVEVGDQGPVHVVEAEDADPVRGSAARAPGAIAEGLEATAPEKDDPEDIDHISYQYPTFIYSFSLFICLFSFHFSGRY